MDPSQSNAPASTPISKKGSSSVSIADPQALAPRPRIWGIAAFLTFAFIVFAGTWQWSRPVLYPPPKWTSVWKYFLPLEIHAEQKLPVFEHADIRSVEVVPSSNRVWIAGVHGLLAYSDDGFVWTMYEWDGAAGVPKKPAPRAQTSTGAPQASLIPSVLAASPPQAQQSNPPPRTQSQTNPRGQQQQQQQQQQPNANAAPLQVTAIKPIEIARGAVAINWSTNLPSTSLVEYGTSIKYGSRVADPSLSFVAIHRLLLNKLKPGTTYHFRVISADQYNQRAVSEDQTFTTSASPAGTVNTRPSGGTVPAPVVGNRFGVSISSPRPGEKVSGEITLSARISGAGPAQSLRFTLDGNEVGATTTAKPYTYKLDTRKFPDGSHVLAAIGRDSNGNSVTSPDITITVSNGVPAPDFFAVFSVDRNNAILIASNLDQFSTKDGGATWQLVPRFTDSQGIKAVRTTHGLEPYELTTQKIFSKRFMLKFRDSANTLRASFPDYQLMRSPDVKVGGMAIATDKITKTFGAWGDQKTNAWICGVARDGSGVILITTDQGLGWSTKQTIAGSYFTDITFQEDALHGWAAGTNGVVFFTKDGGEIWHPVTRGALGQAAGAISADEHYWKFPPLWILPAAFLLGFFLYQAAKRPGPPPLPESIATNAVSDSPLEPGELEVLGLGRIARALSGFLRNQGTRPPITIAINGEWGTGKSSLMNLLRKDLEHRRFCPVWFNAWHNQEEPNLMAAMLQTVKMEAVPPFFRGGIRFRTRLFWGRIARYPIRSVILLSVFAFLLVIQVKLKMDEKPGLFFQAADKIDDTFPSQELKDASRRRVEVLNYLLDTIVSLSERTGQPAEVSKQVGEALPKIGETAKRLAADVKLGKAEDQRKDLNSALDRLIDETKAAKPHKELLVTSVQMRRYLPFATEAAVNASPQQYSPGGVEAIYQSVKELVDSLQPPGRPAETAPIPPAASGGVTAAPAKTSAEAKGAREEKAVDAAQKLILLLPQSVQSQSLQLAGAGPQHDVLLTVGAMVKLLALAGGLLSGLLPLWRSLRAFGEDPASLLTTAAPGKSHSALNQQTSFRKKFAEEFQDVSDALGSRRMAIFIDDLDRCRPDKVSELLEAVNYVTNSGHCLVIMALERKTVEASVGLAFRDIAEERNYQNPDGAPPDADLGDGILGESRRRRGAFAKQYLDKLVNIEVDVPRLTTDRAADVSREEELPPVSWFARVLQTIWAQRWVALGAAFAIFACVTGYYVGARMAPFAPAPEVIAQQPTQPAPEQPGTQSVPAPAGEGTRPKPPSNDTNKAIAAPPPLYQQGEESHPQGASAPFWLIVMMAVIIVVVAIRTILYARREDLRAVEKDSPSFQAALKIWLPVVEARQPTPRSVKRFLNRVRFLACLQQPEPDGTGPSPIPESILIALAALYKVDPQMVSDEKQFESARDFSRGVPLVKPFGGGLEMARRKHEEAFHNWGELASYRTSFLELLPGFTQH